jgi:hypothetical protein
MIMLDDYEEGVFCVAVRKHWWQFWLPVQVVAGSYTTIGNVTRLHAFGAEWQGEFFKQAKKAGKAPSEALMSLEQLIKKRSFTMHGRSGPIVIRVDDLLTWMLEQAQEGRVTLAMVGQGKGDE